MPNQGKQKTWIGIHKRRRRRWMSISSAIISCRGGDSGFESLHYSQANNNNQYVRPTVLVEMDTNIGRHHGGLHNDLNSDNSLDTRQEGSSASTISLTMDVSQCLRRTNATTILIQKPDDVITDDAPSSPPSQTIRISITTLWTMVSQTALLLPSLLITRRILNSTSNAVVDYFRGRYLRTTFTRLERAYLRYYEFPAATRAVFRVAS